MIARLQILGLSVLAVVLVLLGAYGLGSSRARRAAELKYALEAAQRAAAAAKEVRDVAMEVERLPDGSAADRLKRDWLRDDSKVDGP